MYDAMGRRVRVPAQQAQVPTVEDYQALAAAYQELQKQVRAQTKELAARSAEVAVKDEALRRQGEDLKQVQAELVWAKAALKQAQSEEDPGDAENWQERYMRLQAEVENLRRRWEQRSADEIGEARRAILRDMLPLADHLELALQHADSPQSGAGDGFRANIESTLAAFLDALRRYGVTRQEPLGQQFDPALHEAVGQVAAGEAKTGSVAHVVRSGYMEGDRLLRPARVIVNTEQ